MQGKRVIYASIDPAERKRRATIRWVIAALVVVGFLGWLIWVIIWGT